jgi:hypothetical protein
MRVFPGPTQKRYAVWRGVVALASGLLAGVASAATQVDVQREGPTYFVQARAELAADARTAWDTLTDYEHLREFIPDVASSRVVRRDGNHLLVEHDGAFPLFWFDLPVRVRLAVEHEPYARVIARSTPGRIGNEEPTLRSFDGRYVLTVVRVGPRAGVRIDYDARFELARALPPVIDTVFGSAIVELGVRRHFEAMLAEIERRQAARPAIEGTR